MRAITRARQKAKPYQTTFVNSHTYGGHYRSPRGSFSFVTLNGPCQAKADSTKRRNEVGSAVYRAIDFYAKRFRKGQLWQQLLSKLHSAEHDSVAGFMKALVGLEVHPFYRLNRVTEVPKPCVAFQKGFCSVELQMPWHPTFKKSNYDCYYYELIALFVTEDLQVIHSKISTHWILYTDDVPKLLVGFDYPSNATGWLLLLRLHAGLGFERLDTFEGTAMRVIGGGGIIADL